MKIFFHIEVVESKKIQLIYYNSATIKLRVKNLLSTIIGFVHFICLRNKWGLHLPSLNHISSLEQASTHPFSN